MRILLDEDAQARVLVEKLRSAGHDVTTVLELGLAGQDDAAVLAQAHNLERVLITRNARDFRQLHDAGSAHSGVLAVFRGSDLRKNMSYDDIVCGVGNVEAAGVDLNGQFVSLNAWK